MRSKGLRVLYNPFAHVVHMAHSTYQASMEPLLVRNSSNSTPSGLPSCGHMPHCVYASACFSPNKEMYTHIAATRMYTYRILWVDMILPEPDRDSGSVRTLTILKLLLAMRCHVSVVTVQRSGKGRHERYTRMLQYLGVHVIPDFKLMRSFSVREPYDFIVVARRDTFAEARDLLRRHYPNTLLVQDTVDLHFLRERVRRQFIDDHANDTALLDDVFGGAGNARRLSNQTKYESLRELELDCGGELRRDRRIRNGAGALRREVERDGREMPSIAVIANAHEPADDDSASATRWPGLRGQLQPSPQSRRRTLLRAAGDATPAVDASRGEGPGLRLPRCGCQSDPTLHPGPQQLSAGRYGAGHCPWARPRAEAAL